MLRLSHRRLVSISHRSNSMRVLPVPVRDDNYAYLLIDQTSNKAAAVDPWDVSKVLDAAKALGVDLVAILTTHHHWDHSQGNPDLAAQLSNAPVYGGSSKVLALTDLVKDNSEFTIGQNIHIRCLATPCHTQDSICYYATDTSQPSQPGVVFTGDTLFIGGCGRFFEGTGDQMKRCLTYLATLPDSTIIYNGHEYTAGNFAFAKSIDPNGKGIARLADLVSKNKSTTGLTTIGDEKEWNVFMRLDNDAVRSATGASADTPQNTIIDSLRTMKNDFRG